jgi:hypothetical protein
MKTYTRISRNEIREKGRPAPDELDYDGIVSGFNEKGFLQAFKEWEQYLLTIPTFQMHTSLIALMDRDGRMEIEDSEIAIRSEEGTEVIDIDPMTDYRVYNIIRLAYPAEKGKDVWEEVEAIIEKVAGGDMTYWDAANYLKTRYQIKKL